MSSLETLKKLHDICKEYNSCRKCPLGKMNTGIFFCDSAPGCLSSDEIEKMAKIIDEYEVVEDGNVD